MKNVTVINNLSIDLKRSFIRNLILDGEGQFCTVTWETKSGKLTTCNGRAGVKKYLVADKDRKRAKSTKPASKHILTISKNHHEKKGQFRSVTLDKVTMIKAKGQTIVFQG